MRIFVAGATGAMGKRLVPLLVAIGHEVVGTTRSARRAEELRVLGAEPVVLDVLDPEAVGHALSKAGPEVVVHQATALAGIGSSLRKFDDVFEETNRLRTVGTDNLLAAAQASGVERFVAQSFAGWPYARIGGAIKTEKDPLDPSPPVNAMRTLAAIRHLEESVVGADELVGIALRYGGFYGPGTLLSRNGELAEVFRKRGFPIVGSGAGMWSFIHIEDAARATLAAIQLAERGIYNVVDDEPAPASEWLPYRGEVLGAKPPRRVPTWLGRLAAGEQVVSMMTEVRGASNAKAKRELGWQLLYPTWRKGFVEGLDDDTSTEQLRSAA
jgi:nucleoside-diphosphate-sugar epimerase